MGLRISIKMTAKLGAQLCSDPEGKAKYQEEFSRPGGSVGTVSWSLGVSSQLLQEPPTIQLFPRTRAPSQALHDWRKTGAQITHKLQVSSTTLSFLRWRFVFDLTMRIDLANILFIHTLRTKL